MASISTDGMILRKRGKEEEGGKGEEKVEEGLLREEDIDVRME